MPNPKEEEPGEFKVVDRRLFTPDGERRPDAVIESPPAVPKASPTASPKATPTPPKPPTPEPPRSHAKSSPAAAEPPRETRGVQFEQLVMSLLTSAMFQMGLAARPGEPPPAPDFAAAQETIELLTVLQEKTKGNLTQEEEETLTGGLYELRMAFVELSRRMGRPVR